MATRAVRDRAKATTRVEVVESQGEGGFDARKIYKAEAPGVVTIVSLFGSEGGEGSGFVLNGEGEIVTNAHVVTTGEGQAIKRASEVYVEFADGNRVEARVLGHDPNADIALLQVDPKGLSLRPLPLGDSEKVHGRRAGGGDRVAVRAGAVAVGGDRLRGRPRGRVADRSSRSRARSRPTRRSTRATPAGRWSAPTAG